MIFLDNILSVAKYESKLLMRSWFFKVFATLAVVLMAATAGTILEIQSQAFNAIPSMAAYNLMLYLNVAQAIVSIFLASEYLKRDKQLDTSEVFYVRPLSNAEYLLGKMWGTIRVFLLLGVGIVAICSAVTYIYLKSSAPVMDLVIYYVWLNVPTLVYIIGLSTILMLIIKNQALTFVILLGYIGLTLFYIGDKCYYLFDYMGFNIPLMKSTITGMADLEGVMVHRLLYLLAGIGLILCSISLFRRLPNSPRALWPWRAAAAVTLLAATGCGVWHISEYMGRDQMRQRMTELNNRHATDAKMEIDSLSIEVVQRDELLAYRASIKGKTTNETSSLIFTLNPGYRVTAATDGDGNALQTRREEQLLWIEWPETLPAKGPVELDIAYEGMIDERICYLDIPEEMLIEQEKFMGTIGIGKRYAYQTEEYVLLTPETYWYPRPGVCYSDENPDWRQCYFSNFCLTVETAPGMTPVSQGARDTLEERNGAIRFRPEYPLPALSLAIGRYRQLKSVAGGTEYAVWYLEGHDFFSEELDLIADTVPYILEDVRLAYENQIGMNYPFNRFAIVEVPAHFSSYERTWTGAQEKMQPEMVMVAEWMYDNWRFDVKGQKRRRKEGFRGRGGGGRGGRGGGQTMTDLDIQMNVMRDMLMFMMDEHAGVSFQQGQMGRGNITMKASPYYIFPQMYNFRYNIYSTEWTVASRLVELMLQNENGSSRWMRNINGLSNHEKALILMGRQPFRQLQNDKEHNDLLNDLIRLQGKCLFLEAERQLGVQAFKDTLMAHVRANAFRNLSFEALLDTLGEIVGADLREGLEAWNHPAELTEFAIGEPAVSLVTTEEQEVYQAEIVISNLSDKHGSINMEIQFWGGGGGGGFGGGGFGMDGFQIFGGMEKPTEWIVDFGPHETKRIVTHWEENPGAFIINTLFSKNLPAQVTVRPGRVEEMLTLTPEGEYTLSEDYLMNGDDIIVDNEDSTLFSLSVPPPSGYLVEWLTLDSDEEEFKYAGVNEWRAPARWTSTTDQGYYGRSIRSATVIRAGKGKQYAQWKIPVPGAGRYELYAYLRMPEQLRRSRWGGRTKYLYHFNVYSEADGYEEETEMNMQRIDDGWNLIDTYGLTGDTLIVRLTDESELNMIAADAVKLVRKE